MPRASIHEYYLSLLPEVATRATCIRRQVACILTDLAGHILATGYNGPPRNFDHCTDVPCVGAKDEPGNTRNCLAIHAEANALLQCRDLSQATVMYCSCVPCFECAKLIANTEVGVIFALEDYADIRGRDLLVEAGVVIHVGEKTYEQEEES